jgi:hypothetical protein
MTVQWSFYLCPSCFATSETPGECHGRALIHYDSRELDLEERKPQMDKLGQLHSRAPKWFLQAIVYEEKS